MTIPASNSVFLLDFNPQLMTLARLNKFTFTVTLLTRVIGTECLPDRDYPKLQNKIYARWLNLSIEHRTKIVQPNGRQCTAPIVNT